MQQRINYIDRLKGLAILLVVMGHVYGMALDLTGNVAYRVIASFHMSLFMFLSGLVACSGIIAPYWNWRKMGRKVRGLLLPMLIFGLCFTMTFASDFCSGIIGFLESPNKNGYWYLMSLAVFYLSLSVFRLNVKKKWYIDVVLTIGTWGGDIVLWKLMAQRVDYFCLLNCGNFYLFFILGAFCSKYRLTDLLKRQKRVIVVGIIGYIALFGYTAHVHAVQSIVNHIGLPLCALLVIVPLFVNRESSDSIIERALGYVGRHTLDIYVLHYFIITNLNVVNDWVHNFDNVAFVQFLTILLLSSLIVCLCICAGLLLHRSRWIEKVVYGHF